MNSSALATRAASKIIAWGASSRPNRMLSDAVNPKMGFS